MWVIGLERKVACEVSALCGKKIDMQQKNQPTTEMVLNRILSGLLGIFLVGGMMTPSVDLVNNFLTVEQSRSLLQTQALRFDDEDVTEHQLDD